MHTHVQERFKGMSKDQSLTIIKSLPKLHVKIFYCLLSYTILFTASPPTFPFYTQQEL